LKDNVCLAGVPMMNGGLHAGGLRPDVDATSSRASSTRAARSAGKVHCEYSLLGRQPHERGRPRAESAEARLLRRRVVVGQRAVVAAGEVDMAIGGDQGGSIRIRPPTAACTA